MNGLVNNAPVYLEISQHWLKALHGEEGLELQLERSASGTLTDLCKERLISNLQNFLKRKGWEPRPRAFCGIGARGVSLRRLTLPSAGREEQQRLLRLQIESEFPLSPDELAWGCRSLGESRQNGSSRQELLVVAVKKEVIEEYTAVLSGCGVVPVFTLAALARSRLCPPAAGTFALLEVAGQTSELILFDNDVPLAVRTLHWGEETVDSSADVLDPLAESLRGNWAGKKLFVSGSAASFKSISSCLSERFSSGVECEPLKVAPGAGRSAAILGMKKTCEENSDHLLLFQSVQTNGRAQFVQTAPLKWAALAVAMAVGLLLLPYAEALLLKPWLAKKYAAVKTDAARLSTIDREMDFLRYVKQSQPPYLDALYVFAKSAPSGSHIDSVTMNRRGEISLRGSMRSADQVSDFRAKLIDSGFFASVSVDEQAPTPDRQKVNVRMTAQWKPLETLQTLAVGPTAEEIEKAKNRKDTPGGMPGGFPPGGMPMGLPPGAMPGGAVIPPGAVPPGLPPGVELPPGVKLPSVKKENP